MTTPRFARRLMSAASLSALLLTSAWSAVPALAAGPGDVFVIVNRSASGQTVENWRDGYFEVTAEGTAPQRDNPVQWENMAREAARIMAQAQLVELVTGVTLRGRAAVEDGQMLKQVVEKRLQGTIQGAVTVAEELVWEQGSDGRRWPRASATLRLCMQNRAAACMENGGGRSGLLQSLGDAVVTPVAAPVAEVVAPPTAVAAAADPAPAPQAVPAQPGPAQAVPATGLVLDLQGVFDYLPSLDPQVVTASGKELYSAGRVDQTAFVMNGPMQYTDTVARATGLDLLGGNPLVVKVHSVNGDGQIVVSDADAERIAAADATGGFLNQARVAVAAGG